MFTRDLRTIQKDLIEHFCSNLTNGRNVAGWCSMGGGKSAATLVALDRLNLCGESVYPALIIAPPRVARNTWPSEIAQWPDLLPETRVVALVGTADERSDGLKQQAEIYTINYENIEWLIKKIGVNNWPFKTIVCDEATALKNMRVSIQQSSTGKSFLTGQGSVRAKAIAQMVFKYNCKVIELSGTPAPNGLKNLWGQLFLLDKGYRLGRTYSSFEQRWFQRAFDGYGLEPLAHSENEISSKVSDICLSINARDFYGIAAHVTIPVYVTLPPAARKHYKEMEHKLFTEIQGNAVEAFNAASKTNKCSQLASGAAYVGDDDGSDTRPYVEVHNEKIDALHSIVEEANGMTVMVVYHFRSDLARLKKHFPNAVVLDNKKKTEDDFNAGLIPMLIVPYAAGHGLNLQHGTNICVIFSMTWDLETYEQVIERIGPMRQFQSGYKRPVFVYQILAADTIDESMRDRQVSKRRVQDVLLDAVKKRG